jgi:hypothetical protein
MAIVRVLSPTALASRFRDRVEQSFWCGPIFFPPVFLLTPDILAGSFDATSQIAVGFERLYHDGGRFFPCNINLNRFYHGAVKFNLGDTPPDWLSRTATLPSIRQRSVSLLWDFVTQVGNPTDRARIGCGDAVGNILVPANPWAAGVAERTSSNALDGDDLGINTGRAMLQARVDVSGTVHQWLRRERANQGFVFVGRSEAYHAVPNLFRLPAGSDFVKPWEQCVDVLGNFQLEFDDTGIVEWTPRP